MNNKIRGAIIANFLMGLALLAAMQVASLFGVDVTWLELLGMFCLAIVLLMNLWAFGPEKKDKPTRITDKVKPSNGRKK